MRRFLALPAVLAVVVAATMTSGDDGREQRIFNPYERPKNGPPLDGIFHKARPSWILAKLQDPGYHPAARMPDFGFTGDEAKDIMAYLKRIAGPPPTSTVRWPAWARKGFEEMDDDEIDAMSELVDRGKAVWRRARCSICHATNGPGGTTVGGFVDLRVGGIDLQIAGDKLTRDWLYEWIKEPKGYFPDTLMPRFRLAGEEIKALVEYIQREDIFRTSSDEEEDEGGNEDDPEQWKALDEPERAERGRRLIELSRCVICHDVKGIEDVVPQPERMPPPARDTFEFVAFDVRCLSCHPMEGRGGTYAPDLTSAGSRLHGDWVAQFVEAPDIIRPLSQQMPAFNLSADESRTTAAYLSERRRDAGIPDAIPGGPATPEELRSGRAAFRARGCFSCHSVGEEGAAGVVGPDLAAVGDRLQPGYLWYHLKNPHATNPYSAEPDYGLSDEEARALAAYLSTKKKKRKE